MLAKLLVSVDIEQITTEINELIKQFGFSENHPDLLRITEEKLNVEQAKRVKEFFVLKPYQAKGKGVVISFVKETSVEAQNALLKTIEELPKDGWLLIGTPKESIFLPTTISRCQVIKFTADSNNLDEKTFQEMSEFAKLSVQERFYYIEKVKEKDAFLLNLIKYFQYQLPTAVNITELKIFLEQCLQAEKWAKANVNIRGILEYLALNIPKNL